MAVRRVSGCDISCLFLPFPARVAWCKSVFLIPLFTLILPTDISRFAAALVSFLLLWLKWSFGYQLLLFSIYEDLVVIYLFIFLSVAGSPEFNSSKGSINCILWEDYAWGSRTPWLWFQLCGPPLASEAVQSCLSCTSQSGGYGAGDTGLRLNCQILYLYTSRQ